MTPLILLALVWLGARTLFLLAQVARHRPEAQLARAFELELMQRRVQQPHNAVLEPPD